MPIDTAVLRMLALDAAAAEAITALRAAAVEPLLLKGPAIARWLYDDPSQRPYNDVDLLVPLADRTTAARVLADLGYEEVFAGMRASERSVHAVTLRRAHPLPVSIDLHHRFHMIGGDPYAVLGEGHRTIEVSGVDAHVPGDAVLAVIVALHAAQHGPAVPKPVEDLSRAVARADLEVWTEATEVARRLGVAGEFGAALGMVAGGTALARRCGITERPDTQARMRIDGDSPLLRWIDRVRRTPGRGARARLVFDLIVPSPALLRTSEPLARRGPVGVGLAYLHRPVRLTAKYARWGLAGRRVTAVAGVPRGAAWAIREVRACRRQLRAGPLDRVRLSDPPAGRGTARGVRWGLRLARPSCLERSLVRRTWHLGHGRDRRVVIGVSGPGEPFGAHAWLEGDGDGAGLLELLRWPR